MGNAKNKYGMKVVCVYGAEMESIQQKNKTSDDEDGEKKERNGLDVNELMLLFFCLFLKSRKGPSLRLVGW